MKKTDARFAILIFAFCVVVVGAANYIPKLVSVSSSVNGRDLPIYCVQTDKPQIALTFDAAWGDEDTGGRVTVLTDEELLVMIKDACQKCNVTLG